MNNVAVDVGLQVSARAPVFSALGYTHRSGIAGMYGKAMFIIPLLSRDYTFYIPTSKPQGFQISAYSSHLYFIYLFNNSHVSECEVIISLQFGFAFS